MSRILVLTATLLACSTMRLADRQGLAAQSQPATLQYRVLATSKTSTMHKELNEAAEAGFRFQAFIGGETAFGGDEVVAVMVRRGTEQRRFTYKLLATTTTSTMQKELQNAADQGFEYRGQSSGR